MPTYRTSGLPPSLPSISLLSARPFFRIHPLPSPPHPPPPPAAFLALLRVYPVPRAHYASGLFNKLAWPAHLALRSLYSYVSLALSIQLSQRMLLACALIFTLPWALHFLCQLLVKRCMHTRARVYIGAKAPFFRSRARTTMRSRALQCSFSCIAAYPQMCCFRHSSSSSVPGRFVCHARSFETRLECALSRGGCTLFLGEWFSRFDVTNFPVI